MAMLMIVNHIMYPHRQLYAVVTLIVSYVVSILYLALHTVDDILQCHLMPIDVR